MSDVLGRISYDNKSAEKRRLIALVVIILVLSGAWYGLRGTLVRSLAMASVGYRWRDTLIRTGLQEAGFNVSEVDRLWSSSLPRPGWVTWTSVLEQETLPDHSVRAKRWRTTVIDARFRLLGKLPTTYANYPPMDIDGDGRWEVRIGAPALEANKMSLLFYHAVLRMGSTGNEIIWLGLFDESSWGDRGIQVKTKWQDTNGDGVQELLFFGIVRATNPSGMIVFKQSETVASFKLDRPGGLLRPDKLPVDCGIISWSPPNNAPFRVDQTTELGPLFRELLPVPEQPDGGE